MSDLTFKFRCDGETILKLEKLSKELSKTKSEIVRQGIEIQYKRLRRRKKC